MKPLIKWGLFFCASFICGVQFSQDLFDVGHSMEYGKYLFQRKEYNLAIPEFERAVFMNPEDTFAAGLLIKSYLLSGQFEKVEQKVNEIFKYDRLPVSISHDYLKSSIKLRHFNNSINSPVNKFSLSNSDILFYDVSISVYKKDFEMAISKLENLQSGSYPLKYLDILNDKEYTKYKSPAMGMLLSTVVPGLGKVYSGYWKDGLVSFIFVGTSALQSIRGFKKNGLESIYGWFFGGISASFYFGNIYGSGKSAHKRNHLIEDKYYDKADTILFNY